MDRRPPSHALWSRLASLVALVVLGASLASGQSVRWQPDRGLLGVGQTTELQLVFEDCSPEDSPTIPPVPGLTLEPAGKSQSWETINFVMTRRVILTYLARASQRGAVRIPPFEVKTDKGMMRVRQADFQVGDATVGQTGASLDSIVQSRINIPATDVWAGEVFPLSYTLSIARRYSAQLASGVEWSSAPLAAEEWAKPDMAEVTTGGENRNVVTYRTRAMSKAPGTHTLKPAQQLVNLQTGTAAFGLFARPTMEQFTITSPAVTLNVKPLPSPAPKEYTGAVGQFSLTSKVVPLNATVGEPITWTLELSGSGNWPEITTLPSREVSRDFRVVQPQAKRTTKEGFLFEGTLTEDVVLIATQPGTYTLGPVRWAYFDPQAGDYRTVTTDTYTVTIQPAAPVPTASTAASKGTGGDRSGMTPDASPSPPGSPALPRPIPRDPLPGASETGVPLAGISFWSSVGASGVALCAFWLLLAAGRARSTDPLRYRREARDRLLSTLSVAGTMGPPESRNRVLREFLRDSSLLLGLRQATPSNMQLRNQLQGLKDGQIWLELWSEAERALYGADGRLPENWFARAATAVREYPLARYPRFSLFRIGNLAPFLTCLALSLALSCPAEAADPLVDYRAGKFAEAESAWRSRVTAAPTDWIARHNLALVLGQLDRWNEAAAHATAAFVQRPTDPSVQWHLALSLQRAGFTPSELVPFLNGSPLHRLAHRLSPSGWTLALIGAVWVLALALGLLLYRSYRSGPPSFASIAGVLTLAAILLGGVSYGSLRLYRSFADRNVAVVWKATVLRSVPTEALETQKSTALAAGSVGIIDKTFLGWRRLRFPNGQTGWVTAGTLVPLWQAPTPASTVSSSGKSKA